MKPKIELCPICSIPIVPPRVARSRFYEDTRLCPQCGQEEAIRGELAPYDHLKTVTDLDHALIDLDSALEQIHRLQSSVRSLNDKYMALARKNSKMRTNMEALLNEVTRIEHDLIQVAGSTLSGVDFETLKEALEGTYTTWWDTCYLGLQELPIRKEPHDVSTT